MRIMVSGNCRVVAQLSPENRAQVGRLETPRSRCFPNHNLPWAVDNCAFSVGPSIFPGFAKYCDRLAILGQDSNLRFVAMPDIVGDHVATLKLWEEWAPRYRGSLPLAFVLQNGLRADEIPPDAAALFVGGDDEFKLGEQVRIVCEQFEGWVHVGRVNSRKRLRHCLEMGADSVDGTGYSRWGAKYLLPDLAYLAKQRRQLTLWANHANDT